MDRRLALTLAIGAFALVLASPAQAGDVFQEESGICKVAPASEACESNVFFRAAPGESNRVTAAIVAGEMVVTDSGAPLVAGEGCGAGGGEVRCPLREGRGVMFAYLYDGDDRVEMAALGVAYGGTGRDVLTNRRRFGEPFRALFGGPGNDVIRGGADAEILDGDAGSDRIEGGAGDDAIWGDRGRDRIFAGRGDDNVRARDGQRDRVDCGTGRRDSVRADRRDSLRGCEERRR